MMQDIDTWYQMLKFTAVASYFRYSVKDAEMKASYFRYSVKDAMMQERTPRLQEGHSRLQN